ncbi:hypothetical protein BT67DRAFT_82977 [Trichocladium antarcticum]|uniref:Uncharacterized protein n=1 Tax=Trichocladium antarcticum TaxID=1450529 RepID=A0AAN6UH43_9PEZI|nr:hypothetical protein BT67DRAFT_82977 [Trichocladium antarcticum]
MTVSGSLGGVFTHHFGKRMQYLCLLVSLSCWIKLQRPSYRAYRQDGYLHAKVDFQTRALHNNPAHGPEGMILRQPPILSYPSRLDWPDAWLSSGSERRGRRAGSEPSESWTSQHVPRVRKPQNQAPKISNCGGANQTSACHHLGIPLAVAVLRLRAARCRS